MSNGIFHLNTNSSKNIEMCFLTEKEFYFVIFLTEKRSLFCSSFYEVTRNKIICFVNTSNAFYIDGNIPMELRTKWPWDSMTFTRRVKQSMCKGAQDSGLRMSTLVQFRKLWSHWRKNDGSNLGSHWWKYCLRICAKPNIWNNKNMINWSIRELHGEVHEVDQDKDAH